MPELPDCWCFASVLQKLAEDLALERQEHINSGSSAGMGFVSGRASVSQ